MGKYITTAQLGRLIEIDRERGGLREELQEFLLRHQKAGQTYAELQDQFDYVWDGFGRITERKLTDVRKNVRATDSSDHLELMDIDMDAWHMDDALTQIAARPGYVPAVFSEMLVYAKRHPSAQLENPIVCVGEVFMIDGFHYLSHLSNGMIGNDRGLSYHNVPHDFMRYYRVLVRKVA